MQRIETLEQLNSLYGTPVEAALVKVVDRLIPEYRAFIEAAPFVSLATVGPEGIDCSPRGDQPGFVRIVDDRTLMLPDRRGNNRVDSLANIVRDPRVALLFLVPGSTSMVRVNGRAWLSIDAETLASFAVDGHAPRSVTVIEIAEVYFQCSRAVMRAELWNPAHHARAEGLPTAGDMLAAASQNRVGGPEYDAAWPDRARKSLW
ncbi:MAG: pyridoxamine 5'-phosphate oxidase family protein [Hyphomicrobiaceae bacterium]|nr:pyridoxamine 5'-phosphate oxidase family protein [Hyphomicrobiaceae bacterium]